MTPTFQMDMYDNDISNVHVLLRHFKCTCIAPTFQMYMYGSDIPNGHEASSFIGLEAESFTMKQRVSDQDKVESFTI